jgi:hypothetical protein
MGRTSLMMIIVFNMTFMMMGFRLSTATSAAYEKYCSYADIEQAGLILESAANIAISNALLSPSPTTVNDTTLCLDEQLGKAKFTIHRILVFNMYGNRDGDSLVVTGSYPLTGKISILTGKPYEITCTTKVKVRGNSFSQYVFYSESEVIGSTKIYWTDGEVCRGRLHTQDNLYIDGDATFKGKVTTKGSVKISTGAHPVFEKGHTNADVSIPKDLKDINNLGKVTSGGALYAGVKTYVEFKADGRVIVRTGANGWSETSTGMNTSVTPNVPYCKIYPDIASLTSNGVLLVQDAELHVKGVLDGKITLGAVDLVSGSNKGKIFIDSSITYKDPPPSTRYPTKVSDDLLGLVTSNDIMVSEYINSDNTTRVVGGRTVPNGTPNNNVTINASMFCQNGGFGAEDYAGRVSAGTLTVVGGVQQHQRKPVGTGGGSTGFLKDYDFDTNLTANEPVGYPKTPFVVQSWVDNTTIPPIFWE